MSYCRFGEGSDVYVIHHLGGYLQCYCSDGFQGTYTQMLAHLVQHLENGDKVPDTVFVDLKLERHLAEVHYLKGDDND